MTATKTRSIKTISVSEKKRLRSLFTRKGREKEGKFPAEGIRLLEEAIRHNYKPEIIYYSESMLGDRGRSLVEKFREIGIRVSKISARDLKSVSDTQACQGIIGIFNIPDYRRQTPGEKGMNVLLLDGIADPGNAGTLIRSAAAFEFNPVIMVNESVEPYNPKVVRSSAGAIFGIRVIEATTDDILRYKNDGQCSLWAADMKGNDLKKSVAKLKEDSKIIIAIGSEAAGLSKAVRKMADTNIGIRHGNRVESLNAAVAGSIIMMEIYNRKKETTE